jgi:hypothetical protein
MQGRRQSGGGRRSIGGCTRPRNATQRNDVGQRQQPIRQARAKRRRIYQFRAMMMNCPLSTAGTHLRVHCPLRTQRYQFGALLQKAQIFSGEERTAQEISVWKKR